MLSWQGKNSNSRSSVGIRFEKDEIIYQNAWSMEKKTQTTTRIIKIDSFLTVFPIVILNQTIHLLIQPIY